MEISQGSISVTIRYISGTLRKLIIGWETCSLLRYHERSATINFEPLENYDDFLPPQKRELDEQERHRNRKEQRDNDPEQASPFVQWVCMYLYVFADYIPRVAVEYGSQKKT